MPVCTGILLAFLGGVLLLRLVIWQFLRSAGPILMEDFSNAIVALAILLAGLGWLGLKFFRRETIRPSGLEMPLLLLTAAAAVSLLYTVDFPASLNGVLVLAAQVLFFYMLQDLIDSPRKLQWVLIFLMGLAFITAVFGVVTFYDFLLRPHVGGDLQKANGNLYYLIVHGRAISFLGWPTVLAGYLLLFLPLALVLPFHFKRLGQKALAGFLLLSVLVCFLYTFSFLPWLNFLLSAVIVLPLLGGQWGIRAWSARHKRLLVYGFLFFFVLFFWVIARKDFLSSMAPRLFYYKVALQALIQNPFAGYGWDSFGVLCRPLAENRTMLSAYVHNSYLQVWVECGIVGFAAVVWLAAEVFRRSLIVMNAGGKDFLLVGVAWGITAFLIDNLSNFTLLKPNVSLYWWAMLAVFCAMLRIKNPIAAQAGIRVPFMLTGFFLAFMFLIVLRLVIGYSLCWKAQKAPSSLEAIRKLGKAQVVDPWSSYLPAQEASVHMEGYGQTGFKAFLTLARASYQDAVRRSPMVYYNYFALGHVYEALGKSDLAVKYLGRAQELSPAEFKFDTENFNKTVP